MDWHNNDQNKAADNIPQARKGSPEVNSFHHENKLNLSTKLGKVPQGNRGHLW